MVVEADTWTHKMLKSLKFLDYLKMYFKKNFFFFFFF